jgi:hypothetical protein
MFAISAIISRNRQSKAPRLPCILAAAGAHQMAWSRELHSLKPLSSIFSATPPTLKRMSAPCATMPALILGFSLVAIILVALGLASMMARGFHWL